MLTLIFTLLLSSGIMPDRQKIPKNYHTMGKVSRPFKADDFNKEYCIRNRDRVKVLPVHRD